MKSKDVLQKTKDSRQVQDLGLLAALGGYVYSPEFGPAFSGDRVSVLCEGESVLMFGSNDYLSLTRDERVLEAAVRAIREYGSATCGAPLLNGTSSIHSELEGKLAEFLGRESAVLFTTGFQTNLGALSALAGIGDVIITDEYAHMSIADGMQVSYARRARFRHNDIDSLKSVLRKCKADEGKLVVVEGVYSLGGETCPLPQIVEVCREFEARLYLDDAHGIGVLGDRGRGTAEYFDCEREVDLVSGTFSKSLASTGGFVAGSAAVTDYLRHSANAFIFSASLPAASAASVLTALDIIREEPERRNRLCHLSDFTRKKLREAGFQVAEGITPIVIVRLTHGEDRRRASIQLGQFCGDLLKEGFYVHPLLGQAVSFPVIRINLMAAHEEAHVEKLVEVMRRIAPRHDVDLVQFEGVL